ncbi:Hypothetical protein A7982_07272 [Minicystis rosea]|nr:Hypothetical protein A7982_07272 [Minicystis rosea]
MVAALVGRSLCYADNRGEVRCAGVFHEDVFFGKTATDFRVVLPAKE